MKKVIFVCTENTCRSPIAEGIFRKVVAERGIQLEILSAGIFARAGQTASKEAVQVSLEKGIDISKHQAIALDHEIMASADLIITMTDKQKSLVEGICPDYEEKIYTLKEFNGKEIKELNIKDPLGGDVLAYRNCANELECELELFAEIIHKENKKNNL